jgi:hypothetical protein
MQHHKLSSAYNVVVIALASTNSVTFSTSTCHFTNNPGIAVPTLVLDNFFI